MTVVRRDRDRRATSGDTLPAFGRHQGLITETDHHGVGTESLGGRHADLHRRGLALGPARVVSDLETGSIEKGVGDVGCPGDHDDMVEAGPLDGVEDRVEDGGRSEGRQELVRVPVKAGSGSGGQDDGDCGHTSIMTSEQGFWVEEGIGFGVTLVRGTPSTGMLRFRCNRVTKSVIAVISRRSG